MCCNRRIDANIHVYLQFCVVAYLPYPCSQFFIIYSLGKIEPLFSELEECVDLHFLFVVEFLRPVGVFSPLPIPFPRLMKDEAINDGGTWDIWARSQLTSVGCGLLGKFTHLQVLHLIFFK